MDLDRLADRLDRALAALPALPVYVGFSGGLDSTVLLHALARAPRARRRGLHALHVDHGLQAASADWARHCEAVAAALDLPCSVIAVTVECRAGRSIEAAARAARHAAFAAAAGHAIVVLAHHRDDQAETVLLRLLRQSGSAAVAGMRDWRALPPHGWLWRPLLDLGREDLHELARGAGLVWVDDPSNADLAPDRNYLRHALLPGLRARWPQAIAAIAGSAAHLAADATAQAAQVEHTLAMAAGLDPRTLRSPPLCDLDRDALGHVIRHWADRRGLARPPLSAVSRLHAQLQARRGEATGLDLQWADVRLSGYRDLLHLDRQRQALDCATRCWDGRAPLALPDGGRLELLPTPAQACDWQVGARRGGERLRLPGRRQHSRLQQVLQDLGVPPWERAQLPLLWSADGELLAAGDLVVAAPLQDWLERHGHRLRWLPPGAADAA